MNWEQRNGFTAEQMDSFMTEQEEREYDEYMAEEAYYFNEDQLYEEYMDGLAYERELAEPWWAK